MRLIGLFSLFLLLPVTVLAAGDLFDERARIERLEDEAFAGALTGQRFQIFRDIGEELFTARFTSADGAGRRMATQAIIPTKRKRPAPATFQRLAGMDANSCASCHRDPRPGGAGDFSVNVFVSEGFNQADFDTTDPQFSNERNTNHLFGAGLIELLAREMTADLQMIRSNALVEARRSGQTVRSPLTSKGIDFGVIIAEPDGMVDLSEVDGVDTDLVIRPFSHKGVMTSLRQFSVNAANHHHGMQAAERFGARWTGEADFDGDGFDDEVGEAEIAALVAWQANLPAPGRSDDLDEGDAGRVANGERLFNEIGCASCHRPALPLDSLTFADPGPVDAAGTMRQGEGTDRRYDLTEAAMNLPRNDKGQIMVPLFGDLKRHRIVDQQVDGFGNELLAQRFVDRDVFQTTELWGVGSTAPYGHRGDKTTLHEAIDAHGGDARRSRDAYLERTDKERADLIGFLRTLVIP
ncbi:di-heme oxidoredictase family protein [Notoacmeibacter sp. MSK16QG-6]|uniref:di-heme oxidoredictase family protein n=1 Tax=Notoacmeibacter sp. MSK16QG-6 TaxID=2957982 RepID=UPI00209F7B71|nr:di-heme oxidoredictase family protein [Notoacmeibacter sp. MSK16QG-6]MCP1198668.1 hypothetical protein [Notoacmeibacter sp. MSK16QG-6]